MKGGDTELRTEKYERSYQRLKWSGRRKGGFQAKGTECAMIYECFERLVHEKVRNFHAEGKRPGYGVMDRS